MPPREIVVGLDIGTTKVCTLVGEIDRDDHIEILGMGMAPSTGMRKGLVVDIAATIQAIQESTAAASRASGVHIASVYVGVTGDHIRSLNSRATVDVDGEVTPDLVERALLKARQIPLEPDREILHNIPRQYLVDDLGGVRHPVGMSANRLGVETHVVTGSSAMLENVVKCVEGAGLTIEGLVLEPLATGLAVLTDAERALGTVLADIGGGTTDVAFFVDSSPALSAAIPVGGQHVTNDLSLLFRLDPADAESLKVTHGAARSLDVDPEEFVEIHQIAEDDAREIPRMLLPEVIEPRMGELFRLVKEQVDRAAGEGIFVTRCVLSGGGSQLTGTVALARQILEVPVRVGIPRDITDLQNQVEGPIYATAVGLLRYAATRIAARRPVRSPGSLPANAFRRLKHFWRRLTGR